MTWMPYVSTALAVISFFGGLVTHFTYVKVEIEKLKLRADMNDQSRKEMKDSLDEMMKELRHISGGISEVKTHIEHLRKE